MRVSPMAIGICSAATIAAAGIRGRVVTEGTALPVPGALVRLLARGDSVRTDSSGSFYFDLGGSSLRPPGVAGAAPRPARVHAGRLEYAARDRDAARIDLFGIDGRLMRSLAHRPASPGPQTLDLAPLTGGLRGLGWLRLHAGGRAEWIRILSLGAGPEGAAVASRRATSSTPAATGPLARSAAAFFDTLVAETPGFFSERQWVPDTGDGTWIHTLTLRPDPILGMDPAEAEAWRAHLMRPALAVRIGRTRITFPEGIQEGTLVLADGREAASWKTDRCHPGPRPASIRLRYERQGREYRDTLRLEPLWNLFDSYRAVRVDTLPNVRFHLAWDWPQGFSATPGRDWMVLILKRPFAEDKFVSHPNVFRNGPEYGIEGGGTYYDPFDPAGGAGTIPGGLNNSLRMYADITYAHRDDHDARVVLDDRDLEEPHYRFAFTNAWPEGGLVRPGQVLRLQARLDSLSSRIPGALLEMIPEGDKEGPTIRFPWDGSALDWTVPEDIKDTLEFRLKAWVTDPLKTMSMCGEDALSPVLRAVPLRSGESGTPPPDPDTPPSGS